MQINRISNTSAQRQQSSENNANFKAHLVVKLDQIPSEFRPKLRGILDAKVEKFSKDFNITVRNYSHASAPDRVGIWFPGNSDKAVKQLKKIAKYAKSITEKIFDVKDCVEYKALSFEKEYKQASGSLLD